MRYLHLLAIAVLLGLGLAAFGSVYSGTAYLVAGGVGLLGGLLIAGAGAAWRWRLLPMVMVTVVAFFALGAAATRPPGALAGIVPTATNLRGLSVALVQSWKQLLTVNPPVTTEPGLLVIPFVTLLLGSVLAGSVALRLRWPSRPAGRAAAVLPAAVPLVVAILFGTVNPTLPAAVGTGFALVAIVWLAVARAGEVRSTASANTGRTSRILAGAAVLGVAVLLGLNAAPMLTGQDRALLRDEVIPPLDLHEYTSPLVGYRSYVKDLRTTPLLTVTGLPQDTLLRVATFDAYDGRIYNVAASGDRGSDSGVFGRLAQASRSAGTTAASLPVAEQASLTVQVDDYSGVWIPGVARTDRLAFSGPRASDLAAGLFYNPASGTALSTAGLRKGDTFTLTGDLAVHPSDDAIGSAPYARVTLPAPEDVPPEVSDMAAKATTADAAATPLQRARALEQYLHREGFFSDGLQGQVRSRAGHNADRISVLFSGTQMVGDGEQYAVAMALMARKLGMPARVVVGFTPPQGAAADKPVTFTGNDIHAWTEIAFDGVGWVTFDPTPPKDKVPQQEAPKPKTSPKPQVLQPPPPPQQPVDLATATSPGDHHDKPDAAAMLWAILLDVLIVLGEAALVLAALLLPLVVVLAVKHRRRRRRRSLADPVARVAAGWQEVIDTTVDLGANPVAGVTRRETAVALAEDYPAAGLVALAHAADTAAFAPGSVDGRQASGFWDEVDGALARLRLASGTGAWWWGRFNPRSLLPPQRRGGWWRPAHQVKALRTRAVRLVRSWKPAQEREWVR